MAVCYARLGTSFKAACLGTRPWEPIIEQEAEDEEEQEEEGNVDSKEE